MCRGELKTHMSFYTHFTIYLHYVHCVVLCSSPAVQCEWWTVLVIAVFTLRVKATWRFSLSQLHAVWTAYYCSRVNYHLMSKEESSERSPTDQWLHWAMMETMNSRSFVIAVQKLLLCKHDDTAVQLGYINRLSEMYFILAPAQNLKTSRTVCVQLSVGQKMD